MKRYTIHHANTRHAGTVGAIAILHRATLGDRCPFPLLTGSWWLVMYDGEPVGFGGLHKAQSQPHSGYLVRSGIMPDHRGRGLQRRLIRVRERKARAFGWRFMVSDTTDNEHSGRNLEACGYERFQPARPWFLARTAYWRKAL